jgi:Leucine-rich repeat (LRR) protein
MASEWNTLGAGILKPDGSGNPSTAASISMGTGAIFLDTIPEDVSVAAQHVTPRSVANPSTASAVASSDSGVATPRDRFHNNSTKRIDRAKRPQGGGDNLSDTPAIVGGADQATGGVGTNRQLPATSIPTTKVPSFLSPTACTKKSLVFYGVTVALLVGLAVGVYFIVVKLADSQGEPTMVPGVPPSDDELASQSPEMDGPTPDPQFPPYDLDNQQTAIPSSSPSYNLESIAGLDEALLKVSGTNISNLYDPTTPQGKSHYWMTHIDELELRVDVVGDARVQQRYILCVVFYATNGEFWPDIEFLNPDVHECDWYGIACNTTSVNVVDLSDQNLTGTLPQELESLTNLHLLALRNNSIFGTIPDRLFEALDQLIWIDLSGNQLEGTIPQSVGTFPLLENLYLDNNRLQGQVPFFPNIRRALLGKNNLTSFDSQYATSAPFLVDFLAGENLFSGPLPTVWDAPSLERLDFRFNGWTGTIPQDLWDLPVLVSLILDHCQLTGGLPTSSGGSSFQHVWLHANQLSGSIPLEFGAMWSNLTSLLLQGNSLTGAITEEHCAQWPAARANGDNNMSSEWRCESDCGLPTLECSCCTECFGSTKLRRR